MSKIQLLQGDCLELMKQIPDNSIDLILADPPYGILSDNTHDLKGWKNRNIGWDDTIDIDIMFELAVKVLRPNGRCILFSQEPYTSELITKSIPSLPFSYRAVWKKNNSANILGCKKTWLVTLKIFVFFVKYATGMILKERIH